MSLFKNKEKVICVECEHCAVPVKEHDKMLAIYYGCKKTKSRETDQITGVLTTENRCCWVLNREGKCKSYKAKG